MRKRHVAALSAFACLSVMLPALAFAAIVIPFDRFPGPTWLQWSTVYAFDAPVAVLNRALPESARTHVSVLLRCHHTYCFPAPIETEFYWYERVGVPAYAVAFFLPIGFVRLWRKHRGSG
jgi:hypothetical protein